MSGRPVTGERTRKGRGGLEKGGDGEGKRATTRGGRITDRTGSEASPTVVS